MSDYETAMKEVRRLRGIIRTDQNKAEELTKKFTRIFHSLMSDPKSGHLSSTEAKVNSALSFEVTSILRALHLLGYPVPVVDLYSPGTDDEYFKMRTAVIEDFIIASGRE